jgi:hypothetical protein
MNYKVIKSNQKEWPFTSLSAKRSMEFFCARTSQLEVWISLRLIGSFKLMLLINLTYMYIELAGQLGIELKENRFSW